MACGVSGNENKESSFILGHEVSYQYIYNVRIHENLKYHQNSATAVLQLCKRGDIESLLNNSLVTETRRQILQHLIDIALFIGRQGLVYRGSGNEGRSRLFSTK